ncbi:hypothetical protein [Legionella steelei]|nr:hypothetical protein [Legionella steelei]
MYSEWTIDASIKMTYRIDNPGGGDCGFYAFAVGLIKIIQEEYALHKKSETFARWQRNGLNNTSLEDILSIDINKLYNSPYAYKKDILDKLQMSLRGISANAHKTHLLDQIQVEAIRGGGTYVESTSVFHKFMELVHFYLKKEDAKKGALDKVIKFNELALSPEVLSLAKQTAKSLKPKLKSSLNEAETHTIENAHVKAALLNDVMSGREANPRSVILKGADKIKEKGRWATHSDLKEVADQLRVNLNVIQVDAVKPIVNGAPLQGRPTVTLNNEGDTHWTTQVEQLSVSSQEQTPDERPSAKPQAAKREVTLSAKQEHVLNATVSSQPKAEKVERYRQHIKSLMEAASTQGLFSTVKNTITKLDDESLKKEKAKSGESDEDFAKRLQEAEYRRALK